MFENIFETVIKGSNTIFLDLKDSDYYLSYDNINKKAAEEITNNYFTLKQKNGVPEIVDISEDKFTHTVKITVEIDSLNVNKNQ